MELVDEDCEERSKDGSDAVWRKWRCVGICGECGSFVESVFSPSRSPFLYYHFPFNPFLVFFYIFFTLPLSSRPPPYLPELSFFL